MRQSTLLTLVGLVVGVGVLGYIVVRTLPNRAKLPVNITQASVTTTSLTNTSTGTPELLPLGQERGFKISAATLENGKFHVAGSISDVHYLTDVMVVAYKTDATVNQGNQNDYHVPVINGNFDSRIPFELGSGTYSMTLQAPLLQPHAADDVTYGAVTRVSVVIP